MTANKVLIYVQILAAIMSMAWIGYQIYQMNQTKKATLGE